MNLTLGLPHSPKQNVASVMVERLRSLFANDSDRATSSGPTAYAYSFTSECECPSDCLRDHENE